MVCCFYSSLGESHNITSPIIALTESIATSNLTDTNDKLLITSGTNLTPEHSNADFPSAFSTRNVSLQGIHGSI